MRKQLMHAVQYRFTRAELAAGARPDLNDIRKEAVVEALKEYEHVQFHEAIIVPHSTGDGIVAVVRMKVSHRIKEPPL